MKFPRPRLAAPVVCDPIDRFVAPAPGWLKVYSRTVGGIQCLYAGVFAYRVLEELRGGRFCHHALYGKGAYFPASLNWHWLFWVTALPSVALTGFAGGCSLLFLRPCVGRWQFAYMTTLSLIWIQDVGIDLSSPIRFRIRCRNAPDFIGIFGFYGALALPYLPFLFRPVTAALTGALTDSVPRDGKFASASDGPPDESANVGSQRGKGVPVMTLVAAFLIGWCGFLTIREYCLAREDKPFLMKLTPTSGGCLVRFQQPGCYPDSPEFAVDLPVEAPWEFELRPGATPIPGCTVEFCGTTLLPKKCRLRVGETLFILTEDRIEVGGRTYPWVEEN